MLNILKYFQQPTVEEYEFQDAGQIPDTPVRAEVIHVADQERQGQEEAPAPHKASAFTQNLQEAAERDAEQIVEQAKEQAAVLMETARAAANREAEALYEQMREKGYEEGFAEGREEGRKAGEEQALAENREQIRKREEKILDDVERFFRDAADQRDMMFARSQDEMRDLALTVAEKIIRISLQSSSEIVARMVQNATEKLKRREWVRVYIPKGDAQRYVQADPELAASLASLSDQVKIVGVETDDPGACIVELPDEIIDASASTQLDNIRELLQDMNN